MFPTHRTMQARRRQAILAELTQQVTHMYHGSQLASQAIDAVVHSNQHAAALYVQTLAEAEQILEQAEHGSPLSPLQQAALDHYQQAYQYEMLALAEAHGDKIIEILAGLLDHPGGRDGAR